MMAFRQSVFLVPAAAEIAQRQGFFEKRGVKVANVPVLSSGGQRDDLDTGRAEVGITAIDNLLAWNASGSDIALIGQIETTTDLTLMLRPGLASVQDLEVIRLAVDAPTNGFAIVAYAMLSRLGISPGQYEVVEVGGARERFESLADRTVDVSLMAPPLDEMGCGLGMTVAMRVSDLTSAYPGFGVVAPRTVIDTRLDELAAYLSALDAAIAWMRDSPRARIECQLQEAGFGPTAVTSTLAALPTSLLPAREGLAVLNELRNDVNMVVSGTSDIADLVDLRPLNAAGLDPFPPNAAAEK